jgi:hypothetical protein
VTRIFSAEELAGEAGVSVDRIEWLRSIGVLKPPLFRAVDGGP